MSEKNNKENCCPNIDLGELSKIKKEFPPSQEKLDSNQTKTENNAMIYPSGNARSERNNLVDIFKKEENSEKAINNSQEGNDKQVQLSKNRTQKSNTIFGAACTMTNICLGTTIFSFAARAKYFGLVWLLVFAVFCGAVNFWTITRQVEAAENLEKIDYSDVVLALMGNNARIFINIVIIIYSYGVLLVFIIIVYSVLGRFCESIVFHGEYASYAEFSEEIWDAPKYKWPIILGIGVILSFICLMRDMKKLNFASYLAVISVIYGLMVVLIQCNSYYNYYKDNIYKKEIEETHTNYFDLSKAFTTELIFFKGMATLFGAYSCHTGIYPIYETFKSMENGTKKMKWAVLLSIIITTILHIIAITTSFLTEPVNPEDLIIYRINKDDNYDIAMNIAKLLIAISLILSVPGYYYGLRNCIANTFNNGILSTKFNIILTFCSIICCSVIAAVYDKILNYFSYLGGFLAVFVSYLFPILMYIYSNKKGFSYWGNILELIGALILCSIGFIAGIRTIIDDI